MCPQLLTRLPLTCHQEGEQLPSLPLALEEISAPGLGPEAETPLLRRVLDLSLKIENDRSYRNILYSQGTSLPVGTQNQRQVEL